MMVRGRLVRYPTAAQALAGAHDPPSRPLLFAPAGLGLRWIAQPSPFQRSASVAKAPAPLAKLPIAVQDLVDAHDTLARELYIAPPGLGVGWIAQSVPFQRSASDSPVPGRPRRARHAVEVAAVCAGRLGGGLD